MSQHLIKFVFQMMQQLPLRKETFRRKWFTEAWESPADVQLLKVVPDVCGCANDRSLCSLQNVFKSVTVDVCATFNNKRNISVTVGI